MHIEELKEGDSESSEQRVCGDLCEGALVVWDPKKLFIGAGARALFYPTLLYNVVRNKIQSEFRWWDRVDEYVLLGAVPFPTDVVHLKALGVGGVVTLNEPYETLVRSSLYHDHGIEHLLIPTTDYLFAPSHGDICQAVEFIQRNALCGKTTYVHCKAGRGRSTTIVLCYLVKHKQMTPEGAYKYVRSIRPRVQLASSQWQAVKDYYLGLSKADIRTIVVNSGKTAEERDVEELEKSMVVITESDLEGYEENRGWGEKVVSELKVGLWRASWLWVGGHRNSRRGQNVSRSSEVLLLQSKSSNSGVDIHFC